MAEDPKHRVTPPDEWQTSWKRPEKACFPDRESRASPSSGAPSETSCKSRLCGAFPGAYDTPDGPEFLRGPPSAARRRDAHMARPGTDAVCPGRLRRGRASPCRGHLRPAIVADSMA